MSDCPYFKLHQSSVQRRPIGRVYRPQVSEVPWCSHPESSVTHDNATGVIGGGNLLRCGGDLDKCQVPGAVGPSRG